MTTSEGCVALSLSTALVQKGFVISAPIINESWLDEVAAELARIENAAPSQVFILRDSTGVRLMNGLDRASDLLFDCARSPLILDIGREIIGSELTSLHVEYFAKPPWSTSLTPPHQDHVFYRDTMGDVAAYSLWIPLDNVDVTMGCLEYADQFSPALLPHKCSTSPDFDYELVDTSHLTFVAAPVNKGALVVHDSFAVHRAGANLTPLGRRAIVFNYKKHVGH